jgi:hypothetical protein
MYTRLNVIHILLRSILTYKRVAILLFQIVNYAFHYRPKISAEGGALLRIQVSSSNLDPENGCPEVVVFLMFFQKIIIKKVFTSESLQ